MNHHDKTKEQLITELMELRERAALLEALPLGVHAIDLQGRITYVNAAQERITGYSAGELVGTYIWDRMEPISQQAEMQAYLVRLVSEQPSPGPFEGKNVRKNGEVFDVRVDWNYIRSSQGEAIGFVSSVTDITNQKRAEAALRENEARTRLLSDEIECSSQPFGVGYPDGRLGIMNRALCKLTGYSQDELQALGWLALTPPEWLAVEAQHLEELSHTHTSVRYEKEYIRKDGTRLPVELFVHLVCDEAGAPYHYNTFVTDLTERKRAEEALKRAKEELEREIQVRTKSLQTANEQLAIFQRFAEAAGQGFGMADMEGKLTYVNSTCCQMAGIQRPEDIIGKHFTEFYPEENSYKMVMEVTPALLQKGQWEGEMFGSLNGNPITVLQHSFLIRDLDGEPFRLASVITDITERKRIEEALRKSEEQYRRLVDASPYGVIMTDLQGNITFASRQMLAMHGSDHAEEVIGRPSLDFIASESREAFLAHYHKTVQHGISQGTELVLLKRDGTSYPVEASATAILDAKGEPTALMAVLQDITERKRAEEALRVRGYL